MEGTFVPSGGMKNLCRLGLEGTSGGTGQEWAKPGWNCSPSLRPGWKIRGPSGAWNVWAWRVKSPGHCASLAPLLQRKALGSDAACHLLGAQGEPKNVLVVALLILWGKRRFITGVRDPQWVLP